MSLRSATVFLSALAIFGFTQSHVQVAAITLVGDPFVSPYTSWLDAFPARQGNWRLSLHNPTLMDTNNLNPPTSGATTNDGTYEPDVLIQNNFLAPESYDLSATMRTNDDDIIGLVWNYLDPENYFRVGIRQQNAGSFGGTQGLAVQKIVGGTVTQINPAGVGPGAASPITQAMIDNRTPFQLRVAVNGNSYEVFFDGTSIVSGTDDDLRPGRKIGVQSWAQREDTSATPWWGTEVERISVADSSGILFNETFDARPVQWRPLAMANSEGIRTNDIPHAAIVGDDQGNFGLDIDDPWIYQQTNGFEWATTTAPNVDFIGPAVVVDEPGSENFRDYEMRVRLGSLDNDGIGVLVRVQDDDNFYRVNFASEAIGTTGQRAPQGLSVQKVQNGVWSELFRDDQENPLFVYQNGPAGTNPATGLNMFDLIVRAVGDTLAIQVTDHLGNVFDYPLIVDSANPLLTGTVGLANWGNDNSYFMSYGGEPGPLVTLIPEPASVMLLLAAAGGLMISRRRR